MLLLRLMDFWTLHLVALVIRLCLAGYGIYQDKTMEVKYTDIDFHVFTDACRFVTQVSFPVGVMRGAVMKPHCFCARFYHHPA